MNIIEGNLEAKNLKFAIAISRFNELISEKLLEGAKDCLVRHGADEKNITLFWVPGALEIPLVAQKAANAKEYDAVIALGAVIQGDTPHFDIVAAESAKGIANAALASGTPIINGILTTNTIEQAMERAGTKAGNKGFQAAQAAIEMANLIKNI